MSSVAERVHRAMSAASGLIDSVPPLRLDPEPGGQGRSHGHRRVLVGSPRRSALRWAVPLTAAAAVVALAVALVTIRDMPNGPVTSPGTQNLFPSGVPRYYAAIVQPENSVSGPDQVQIRETLTGKLVATVKPPAGATFAGVTGAAGDLTWVLDTQPGTLGSNESENQSVHPRTWYLLRLSPGSPSRTSLTRLPIPPTAAGTGVNGIALSPDGTRLAVAQQWRGRLLNSSGQVTLRVYSVRTGAVLGSWRALASPERNIVIGGGPPDANQSLAWLDGGRSLAFGVLTIKPGKTHDGSMVTRPAITSAEIRVLPVDTPGSAGLLSARVQFALATPATKPPYRLGCRAPGTGNLLFTRAGHLICGGIGTTRAPVLNRKTLCAAGPAWYQVAMLEYTPSRRAVRVLRQHTLSCAGPLATIEPIWTDPSGRIQLGFQGLREHGSAPQPVFGVFRNGRFTPLPLPVSATHGATGDDPLGYIAWLPAGFII